VTINLSCICDRCVQDVQAKNLRPPLFLCSHCADYACSDMISNVDEQPMCQRCIVREFNAQ